MILTSCPLCSSKKNYQVLYQANFRRKDLNKTLFSARRLPDEFHYQIVKCRKDNLVRSNPILNLEDIERFYKQSSIAYQKEIPNLKKTYLNVLKPYLKELTRTDKILEIGCGNGFLLEELFKMGYSQISGIEPSLEAVRSASKNIKKKIIRDILKKGIFPQNSFKFIFLFQTLDHIPNPNQLLSECFKLLKKNGIILAFNHDFNSLFVKLLKDKSPIIDIEHTFFYTPQTARLLFEKNRFQVLGIYSPKNIISLNYLIWLFPLPKVVKIPLLNLTASLKFNLSLKLGNLYIAARK
ncbi:class I SAM-dependent methyltransferase [Candidatus Daviesbacteria bacterium]|nr:class I SAM-dependent methyltransferase [Candidatus Daviesbacteria bacterium]